MSFGNSQSGAIQKAFKSSNLDTTATSDAYKPFGVTTGFGNTQRQNGSQQFNISDDIMNPLKTAYTNANTAYGNSLGQLIDPSAAMQQARDTYANYMIPAFNKQSEINQGNQHASLGNAYQSTFGQLTQHQAGLDDAIARANLDAQIYNQGNQRYSQMIADTNALGNAQQETGNAYYQPYQNLQSLLGTSGQLANDWTNMVAGLYKSKIGTAQQVMQNTPNSLANAIGALSPLGGAILGQNNTPAQALSPAASGAGGGITSSSPIQTAASFAAQYAPMMFGL